MSVDAAVLINGWMSVKELAWLSARAKEHSNIVEIGSFLGRSTMALADSPGIVYAVDTFKGSEEHQGMLAGVPSDYLFDQFNRNLADQIGTGKVKAVPLSSLEAAKHFSEQKFDMVFIDAAHEYESVKADIAAWLPLIADGGLLCGHDYENGTSGALERAVRELIPNFNVEESIWYTTVPLAAVAPRHRRLPRGGKTLFTLNIGGYAPEITSLTYPLLKHYAHKIGADFEIITERQFPNWPVVYEKMQIHELGKGNDWNIYIDSDALIHPDMFDPTDHLHKDTVGHNGNDMAGNRWRYDRFFRRDARHVGSCNWFTFASDWCIDLWKPLDDLTLPEALENIFPIQQELNSEQFSKDHLIDDYTLSRNIAKFGLKFKSIQDIQKDLNDKGNYVWHAYTLPQAEKVRQMKDVLRNWGIAR